MALLLTIADEDMCVVIVVCVSALCVTVSSVFRGFPCDKE